MTMGFKVETLVGGHWRPADALVYTIDAFAASHAHDTEYLTGRAARVVHQEEVDTMTSDQAVTTLRRALDALFPYADPSDDPDTSRAADQRLCREALQRLVPATTDGRIGAA